MLNRIIAKFFIAGLCALGFVFFNANPVNANPIDKVGPDQIQNVRMHAITFPKEQPGGIMISTVDSVDPRIWRMNFRLDNEPEITLANETGISIKEFRKVMHQYNWIITYHKLNRRILGIHQLEGEVTKSLSNTEWEAIRFDYGQFEFAREDGASFKSEVEKVNRSLKLEAQDVRAVQKEIGKGTVISFNINTGRVIRVYKFKQT